MYLCCPLHRNTQVNQMTENVTQIGYYLNKFFQRKVTSIISLGVREQIKKFKGCRASKRLGTTNLEFLFHYLKLKKKKYKYFLQT